MRGDNAFIKVQVTENDNTITYGTAYRVNNDFAITALHVMTQCKAIKFIFPCNTEILNYEIAYKNSDYDIAIISFPEHKLKSLPAVERIQIGSVQSDDRWHGAGYPKFAENNQSRKMVELKGKTYHHQEGNKLYDLDCAKDAIKREWGGVSGSPVFVNDKLAGVILKFARDLKNTHFRASPIWELLTEDKFRHCFINREIDEQIKAKIQKWFESNEHTLKLLSNKEGESALQVTDNLVKYDLPELIAHLETKISQHSQSDISQLACQLLPYYFVNQAVIIDEALIAGHETAIDLECVSEVAAECSVAAFSKRPINIGKEQGQLEGLENLVVTKGKFALGPEVGIDEEEKTIESFTNDILSQNAIDHMLEKYFSRGSIDPVAIVNQTLDFHRKRGNHYYLVLRLKPELSDYKEKVEMVKSYRKKYPKLIIINLSSNSELAQKENFDLLLPLPTIL